MLRGQQDGLPSSEMRGQVLKAREKQFGAAADAKRTRRNRVVIEGRSLARLETRGNSRRQRVRTEVRFVCISSMAPRNVKCGELFFCSSPYSFPGIAAPPGSEPPGAHASFGRKDRNEGGRRSRKTPASLAEGWPGVRETPPAASKAVLGPIHGFRKAQSDSRDGFGGARKEARWGLESSLGSLSRGLSCQGEQPPCPPSASAPSPAFSTFAERGMSGSTRGKDRWLD